MLKKFKKGFSLLELLVVIGIIALLSAIAIPSMLQYTVRAKVQIGYSYVQKLAEAQATIFAQTNVWPTAITVNGITNNTNQWFLVNNYQYIYALIYKVATDNMGAYIGVALADLEWMPGYTEPSSDPFGSFSHYQTIYYGFREINGVMTIRCGSVTPGNSAVVPPQYLPSACSCTNVNAFMQNGTQC